MLQFIFKRVTIQLDGVLFRHYINPLELMHPQMKWRALHFEYKRTQMELKASTIKLYYSELF